MVKFVCFNGVYFLILGWLIFSIYYLFKLRKKPDQVNPYIFDSIPSVFTTLGIFGTFIGIAYGLWFFNVNKITESIPELLKGLKTAFLTSIIGIIFSLIFSKINAIVVRKNEKAKIQPPSDELSSLNLIIELLDLSNKENVKYLTNIQKSVDQNSKSVLDLINSNNNTIIENINEYKKSNESSFQQVNKNIDKTNNYLFEINKNQTQILNDQKESINLSSEFQKNINITLKSITKNIEEIIKDINSNNKSIIKKFDEFNDLMRESNTKALVEAMESVIKDFNNQMNELIQRLVKENFEELNNSVQLLNNWQIENKIQVEKLINQFHSVSNNLEESSLSIKKITDNTKVLTDENGILSKLIYELQSVIIEDTKFKEITNIVSKTIDTLNETTYKFEETSKHLNEWVKKEHNIKESVDILITRLKEIENIKEINGEFWKETKNKMNEGLSIIATASERLNSDIDSINSVFYERLNDTLQSLDQLIQRLIIERQRNN